jgi:hypothetical protein
LDLSGIGDGIIVSTVCSRFRRFIATFFVHFLSFLITAACSVLSKLHDRLSILSPLDLRGRKLIYIIYIEFFIFVYSIMSGSLASSPFTPGNVLPKEQPTNTGGNTQMYASKQAGGQNQKKKQQQKQQKKQQSRKNKKQSRKSAKKSRQSRKN